MARAGELVVVRHGAYADAPAASALDRHRRLIDGTSHFSATQRS